MTKDEIGGELLAFIGKLMCENPDTKWRDMYDAIYVLNDHYKFLESLPGSDNKNV